MGNFSRCTSLFLQFWALPPRGDSPTIACPPGWTFTCSTVDTLLTFAAVTVEGFDQSREGPGELVRLVQVLAPTFERLLIDHRASVALHSGVMACDRLTDQLGPHPWDDFGFREAPHRFRSTR